jgi:TolB-like protein/DNA-binding winged helix-turn-helix (wHTH) protein
MFQFAGYTLDVERGSLGAADREINLRPKSYEVLRYLVEHADRLVTKEELIKEVWPDVIATDESLARCISEVRHAIGDEKQSIIKTVAKRGYKLTVAVQRVPTDQASDSGPRSGLAAAPSAALVGPNRPGPPLPDRPSIAVLPFENISGDPGQGYFADGMVEEIITALTRFSGLFVIARNSSFTYKGRSVDVRQVGRELGVRYVLEGSIRKGVDRVRITGQLIDAANGTHLWADRFDGSLEDLLDLQDQVTSRVVAAIAPKLEQAEIERAKTKPTERLDAYDYSLRGMECMYRYQRTKETIDEALRMFLRAIELDPEFAGAYGMAARCYIWYKANRWTTGQSGADEAARLARKAIRLSGDDAAALSRAGHALAYVVGEFDTGTFLIDRALALNPNLATAWSSSGHLRFWLGDTDTTIKHIAQFQRLSPRDPYMHTARSVSAFAHAFGGRYDEALAEAASALQEAPHSHLALRAFATVNALAGKLEAARTAMQRLREMDPSLRVCNLKDLTPLCRPEDMARYQEGMRKAGLPA